MVCATSKASDQPAHTHSLIRACAYAQSDQSLCLSLEYSMTAKLLTEHHLEAVQARLNLHMSKCHIVGNHVSRLTLENSGRLTPCIRVKHIHVPDLIKYIHYNLIRLFYIVKYYSTIRSRHLICNVTVSCKANREGNQLGVWLDSDQIHVSCHSPLL